MINNFYEKVNVKKKFNKLLNKKVSQSLFKNLRDYNTAYENINSFNKSTYNNKSTKNYKMNESYIKLSDLKKYNPEIKNYRDINSLLDDNNTKDYYNKYLKDNILFDKNIIKIDHESEFIWDKTNLLLKLDLHQNNNYLFKIKNNFEYKIGYLKIGIFIRIS